MKKTLTLLSSTFLTMALANAAQAMKMTVHESVDDFSNELSAPLEVYTGVQKEEQDNLSNVMGGQRTTELSVQGCLVTPPLPECANLGIGLDINNNGQLVVNVGETVIGEARASVKYGKVENMNATSYEGFLVYLAADLEAQINANFELSIKSGSDITLLSPMFVDADEMFFDFSSLNNSQLDDITYLELSAFGFDAAFDLIIDGIGFTLDRPPTQMDVPEPSSLMSLASVLGLAIFAKRGKKQV